jgi:DNA (cytosine-5)-methyltransferase 1
MKKSPKFVDLFAGCGGLSLGLENAGFHPIFVNELNKNAMESYLQNRLSIEPLLSDKRFHEYDVKKLVSDKRINELKKDFKKEFKVDCDEGELDLLVGGPPCQGFSGIGHRRSYSVDKIQLPSNHLYQDMAWIISQLNPKIFLFENVRGLLNSKWTKEGKKGEIFKDVLETFKSIGNYKVEHQLIYSKDYGAPQNRPRILIVGVRKDVDTSSWEGELKSSVANGFLPEPTNDSPNLIDVLGDLVDSKFEYGGETKIYKKEPLNAVQKALRTTPDGSILKKGAKLTEQEYSNHSNTVQERFQYMIDNNGNIPPHLKTKKFAQRLLPSKWDEKGPSITVCSLPDDYVHFNQPRVLTVREWARLQGFPDWYQFDGSRTTGGLRRAGDPTKGIYDRELPKYTQIGNAVPVYVAEKLGHHFKKIL